MYFRFQRCCQESISHLVKMKMLINKVWKNGETKKEQTHRKKIEGKKERMKERDRNKIKMRICLPALASEVSGFNIPLVLRLSII